MTQAPPAAVMRPRRPGVLVAALLISTILMVVVEIIVVGMVVVGTVFGATAITGWVLAIMPVPILVGVLLAWLDRSAGRIIYAAGTGIVLVFMILIISAGERTPTISSGDALVIWGAQVVPSILFFLPPSNTYFAAVAAYEAR